MVKRSTPRRIQRRRTKGWRTPEGAVYVGRPTRWGNPVHVGDEYQIACDSDEGFIDLGGLTITPEVAVAVYRRMWDTRLTVYYDEDRTEVEQWQEALETLRGKDLMCWCPLEDAEGNRVPCHADVLLELANR